MKYVAGLLLIAVCIINLFGGSCLAFAGAVVKGGGEVATESAKEDKKNQKEIEKI